MREYEDLTPEERASLDDGYAAWAAEHEGEPTDEELDAMEEAFLKDHPGWRSEEPDMYLEDAVAEEQRSLGHDFDESFSISDRPEPTFTDRVKSVYLSGKLHMDNKTMATLRDDILKKAYVIAARRDEAMSESYFLGEQAEQMESAMERENINSSDGLPAYFVNQYGDKMPHELLAESAKKKEAAADAYDTDVKEFFSDVLSANRVCMEHEESTYLINGRMESDLKTFDPSFEQAAQTDFEEQMRGMRDRHMGVVDYSKEVAPQPEAEKSVQAEKEDQSSKAVILSDGNKQYVPRGANVYNITDPNDNNSFDDFDTHGDMGDA